MGTTGARQGQITRHGLFVDVRGDAGSRPLLFLHGGPGQGCYDFMAIQGDLLSGSVLLIGLDQRGVDRSAPLPSGATLTVADLVADCEEVRQELGIGRWAVLGQSSGGGLALRYAAAHPAATVAAIFENPVWDMASSARAALVPLAAMLASQGKDAEAQAARDAAAATAAPGERPELALRAAYLTALAALGADRERFFVPDPATRARLAEHHASPRGDHGGPGVRRVDTRPAAPADPSGAADHRRAGSADRSRAAHGLPQRVATAPGPRICAGRHFVHAEDPVQYADSVMNLVRSCT